MRSERWKEIEAAGGRGVAMEVDISERDSLVELADRVDAELAPR
jgi:hypothetical protein